MAHLPLPSVPEIPGPSQTKTLHLYQPGQEGVLVEYPDGRRHSTAKQFANAHAALDWCVLHNTDFHYHLVADPAQN